MTKIFSALAVFAIVSTATILVVVLKCKHDLIEVREQIDIIENMNTEYVDTAQNYIDEQTQSLKQVRQVLNELKEKKND